MSCSLQTFWRFSSASEVALAALDGSWLVPLGTSGVAGRLLYMPLRLKRAPSTVASGMRLRSRAWSPLRISLTSERKTARLNSGHLLPVHGQAAGRLLANDTLGCKESLVLGIRDQVVEGWGAHDF